jgi:uncharacterized SAM-binding protein YcdF (DUF218 family)
MWRKNRRRTSASFSKPSGAVRGSTLLSRFFFLVGLTSAVGIGLGFVWFSDHVVALKTPTNIEAADGAASLTGGSDLRLKVGVALVERGTVPRLLISGVNKVATRDEVRLVAGGRAETYACCIDLGRIATDTVGNAAEVSDWVSRHKVKRLILITDNYHMPRSLFEVRRANPGIAIVPFPVQAAGYADQEWWKNERMMRGLALEYGKLLVAIGRSYIPNITDKMPT